MKIPPVGAELFYADGRTDRQTDRQTDKQTDVTTLTVTFLNFAKAPQKCVKGITVLCGKSTTLYLHPLVTIHLSRQSKVTNFDDHVLAKEHVTRFEVTMYHMLTVNIADTCHKLAQVVPYLRLCYDIPQLQNMHQ